MEKIEYLIKKLKNKMEEEDLTYLNTSESGCIGWYSKRPFGHFDATGAISEYLEGRSVWSDTSSGEIEDFTYYLDTISKNFDKEKIK